MPAGYAHYIFGQKVLNSLDKKYQDLIKKHIDLYNIGVHGPDILFYYKALKNNPVKAQGSKMHSDEAYDFFKQAKEKIKDEKDLVYIYGFITHFILDHACHHYIFNQQKELNMTHSEIESELDRKLLVINHLDPLKTSLTRHIVLDHDYCKTIAPFFDLTEKEIYKSIKDLLFYLSMIKAPGHIKRNFVYFCMKTGGIYDEYHGLLINYKENKKSIACTNHLVQTIDNSIEIAKKYIQQFNEQELDDIYHHNFE